MNIIRSETVFSPEGYERVRIPGIVTTSSGTLVAYCELRQGDSDWSVIDIGMRKSSDGGHSWSDLKILVSGNGRDTVNNPLMIADGKILHFLYCVNYRRVFYMTSSDEGESWSVPRELTDCIKEQTGDFFWSCIATGPAHGIALSTGELLVPVWLAYNKEDAKSHHPSVIAVLYSADKGKNWRTGKICAELSDPSEFSLAQLSDGRVFANIRHEGKKKCRAVALLNYEFSLGDIFFCENLPDPVCCAGFSAYKNGFLFTNCNSENDRINLTLKRLNSDFSVSASLLLSKAAGYSDVAIDIEEKTAYVLFEKEEQIDLCVVEI